MLKIFTMWYSNQKKLKLKLKKKKKSKGKEKKKIKFINKLTLIEKKNVDNNNN